MQICFLTGLEAKAQDVLAGPGPSAVSCLGLWEASLLPGVPTYVVSPVPTICGLSVYTLVVREPFRLDSDPLMAPCFTFSTSSETLSLKTAASGELGVEGLAMRCGGDTVQITRGLGREPKN